MLEQLKSRLWRAGLPWWAADAELRAWLAEVKYGHRYRIVGVSTLRLDELRVRKEPASRAPLRDEAIADGERSALLMRHPIDRFFPSINGIEDRRIKHLPHLALLDAYAASGRAPSDSAYAELLRCRARLANRPVDEPAIAARVRALIDLRQSILTRGYAGPGFRRKRISVMEAPLHPATEVYRPEGYEIFDGHHRAAVLAHLGIDPVQVLVLRAEKVGDFTWCFEEPRGNNIAGSN